MTGKSTARVQGDSRFMAFLLQTGSQLEQPVMGLELSPSQCKIGIYQKY